MLRVTSSKLILFIKKHSMCATCLLDNCLAWSDWENWFCTNCTWAFRSYKNPFERTLHVMLSHFILFIIHSWIETPSPRISGLSNGSFNPKDARDAILTVGHWSWVVVWLWWGWVQPGRPARPQVPDHITAAGRPPPRQTQNPDIKICTLKRYKQHFSTGVMNRLNCQKVGRRNISFFIQIYIPDLLKPYYFWPTPLKSGF